MALPTLIKTWQVTANTSVAPTGTAQTTMTALMIAIKNVMKGVASGAWTVVGSSDARSGPLGSSGLDGVDRWANTTVVVPGNAGTRHPWIVLRQTGIATNYEVCIDLFAGGNFNYVISPSAGFTGGSDTNRPTATDEIALATSYGSNSDIQHYVHAWQSTDGQCTRLAVYAGGTLRNFVIFDKPQNPVSGWTNPSYGFWSTTSVVSSNWTTANGRGRGTTTINIGLTGEGAAGALLTDTAGVGTTANSFDGSWTFWPIGMFSTTASNIGRLGSLFDIWWRPSSLAPADTFPNNATARQFVCVAGFILPWKGDSTTMLLT